MGDSDSHKSQSTIVELAAAEAIIYTGITNPSLRDEIYTQVIKQLHKSNPKGYFILFFFLVNSNFITYCRNFFLIL